MALSASPSIRVTFPPTTEVSVTQLRRIPFVVTFSAKLGGGNEVKLRLGKRPRPARGPLASENVTAGPFGRRLSRFPLRGSQRGAHPQTGLLRHVDSQSTGRAARHPGRAARHPGRAARAPRLPDATPSLPRPTKYLISQLTHASLRLDLSEESR